MSRDRPFLLLDRDGTLIEERNYLSDPEGVALIPGAAKALATYRAAGWGIAVITNQAGIGRGYYGLAEMHAVNARVNELLSAQGVVIDAFYACPHHPDADCDCRKPRPGMVWQAVNDFGFDPANAVVVGDKACDLELARSIGARGVLVRTGHGSDEESASGHLADWVIDSLADLLQVIKV